MEVVTALDGCGEVGELVRLDYQGML